MTMDKALHSAATSLADQMAEIIDAHTFEPELGRVWAVLLLTEKGQTADEVATILGEDPDTVDQAMEQLVELGAARGKGERYSAVIDPLQVAASFVKAKELPLIGQVEDALLFARDRLAKSSDAQAALARTRVEDLARQVTLIKRLLQAVASSGSLELDKLLRALGS
ncbi:MAG: hypothetical protein ABIJ09_19060 [Pseudomonadota bacterium]